MDYCICESAAAAMKDKGYEGFSCVVCLESIDGGYSPGDHGPLCMKCFAEKVCFPVGSGDLWLLLCCCALGKWIGCCVHEIGTE